MGIRKLRILPYRRVSSPPQKRRSIKSGPDEPSLEQQRAEVIAEAHKRKWEVVGNIEDVISGSVPVKDRPGGSKIYEAIEEDEFDVLGIYDNDRIGRDEDAVVAKVFRADMRFAGKQIFSVHQPIEPKPTHEFKPYEDDSSLWLEAVSDTASSVYIRQFRRKHAFGMQKRIEQKKLITGTPPTGYIAERHVLPNGKVVLGKRKKDELYAPIIQRIFNEYESGLSMQGIAGSLNKDGITTPKGFLWTSTTIKGIINNPTYYGAAPYYKDKSIGKPDPRYPRRRRRKHMPMDQWLIVEDAEHPAIILKEQWLKCQAIKKSKGSYGRTYGESTLLSGLPKCGYCGGSMFKQSSWGGGYFSCNRYYKTGKTQCQPNSIRRIFLERDVVEYISLLSKDPEVLNRLKVSQNNGYLLKIQSEYDSVSQQKEMLKIKLKKAREVFDAGIDTVEEYGLVKAEVIEQDEALANKLSQLENNIKLLKRNKAIRKSLISLLSNFSEKFYKKPLRIRKVLLREIVEKIVVKNKKGKIIFKDNLFNTSEYERTIEIAAAGGHNILLKGPPGAGKTMLARAFPSILPPLTFSEAIETTKIYSVAGLLPDGTSLITTRPFRSPHHSASHIGLIGGGNSIKPGEISLAHRGVLFMDELPEFPRQVLEALRQPLEDHRITISRASGSLTFPAQFILMAAQNPCPCGFLGDKKRNCSCMPGQIAKYKRRISGPLLDRIDIYLEVPAVEVDKLSGELKGEESKSIRDRVTAARKLQQNRFKAVPAGRQGRILTNSEMGNQDIKEFCAITPEGLELLKMAISSLNLSARGYHRVLKLARTIADLAGSENILTEHIAEALQYRARDES